MKKNIFLTGALGTFALALSLVSCSSENDGPNINNGEASAPHYMSISIAATPGSSTRATADDNNPEGAVYEDGEGNENAISSVRFYFFDADGKAKAAHKKDASFVNFIQIDNPDTSDPKPGEAVPGPIEKIIDAQLVLQTPKGDNISEIATMVAIVNPSELTGDAALGDGNLSLSDLQAKFGAYTAQGEKGFIMSNSVFADEGKEVVAQSIAGKIKTNATDATNDPVVIFVERVLAKVSVSVADVLKNNTNNITVGGKTLYYANKVDTESEPIYIDILGWNATATADNSNLLKKINPSWTGLFANWTYSTYSRSYWAMNPATVNYQYGPFNTENANNVANGKALGGSVYIQENANDNSTNAAAANPTTPTQVIIAGQLVDATGAPVDIAEYGFVKYKKENVATAMLNNVNLYKQEGSNYNPITKDDVEFKTATEVNTTDKGRYCVYLQLKTGAPTTWYKKENGSIVPETEDINKVLIRDAGSAKIWNEGYTYWFADIKHLASTGAGSVGVVRNHSYKVNITQLEGLGTPVYKPGEEIIPEKPKNDDSFIAAMVKVLSWRVVSKDYTFEW